MELPSDQSPGHRANPQARLCPRVSSPLGLGSSRFQLMGMRKLHSQNPISLIYPLYRGGKWFRKLIEQPRDKPRSLKPWAGELFSQKHFMLWGLQAGQGLPLLG